MTPQSSEHWFATWCENAISYDAHPAPSKFLLALVIVLKYAMKWESYPGTAQPKLPPGRHSIPPKEGSLSPALASNDEDCSSHSQLTPGATIVVGAPTYRQTRAPGFSLPSGVAPTPTLAAPLLLQLGWLLGAPLDLPQEQWPSGHALMSGAPPGWLIAVPTGSGLPCGAENTGIS